MAWLPGERDIVLVLRNNSGDMLVSTLFCFVEKPITPRIPISHKRQRRCRLLPARILLLGAGGAARGVVGPLLQQSPKCLVIANRSNTKADELVKLFADLAASQEVALESRTLLELENAATTPHPFDLVINATAAGLTDESPLSTQAVANIFVPSSFAYDMVYGKSTAFMQQALKKGARVSDGLGMLVEQAADAFLLWRGEQLASAIDPRAVLAKLRS